MLGSFTYELGGRAQLTHEREAAPADRAMAMMIQRVNTNQLTGTGRAVKSRARGPTITQLRAKQAALVAAAARGFK